MGLVENRRQMAQLPIEVELENENEDDNVSANKRKYVMKRFNVFHASQIEGIPPYAVSKEIGSEERNEELIAEISSMFLSSALGIAQT